MSLLAAPHYRPVALVLQTAVHLARAVFGRPDARAWHLLIAATGLLFIDPVVLQSRIERVQEWLQPAVSYDTGGRFSARGNRRGGRGRRPSRNDRYGHGSGRAAGVDNSNSSSSGSGGRDRAAVVSGGGGSDSGGGLRPTKKLPLQPKPSAATVALICIYLMTQVLLPMRHVLGVLPVEWSREGHDFSWRAGGGVGGRGGSGGLVREEALVRMTHHPRSRSSAERGSAGAVQTVHLYGAPLTAQQVG